MKEFWVRTLKRTPKWVLLLVAAALYALYSLGEKLLTGEQVRPGHIVGAVFAGVVVAAAGFLTVRWQSRRDSKKPPGSLTATNFRASTGIGQPTKGRGSLRLGSEVAPSDPNRANHGLGGAPPVRRVHGDGDLPGRDEP
jgi:hypothetical protein